MAAHTSQSEDDTPVVIVKVESHASFDHCVRNVL